MNKRAFSLIELLVVIAITATFIAVVAPNYLSGRQRASDSKKKAELQQLKMALGLYYADHKMYPHAYTNYGQGYANTIEGCGADGDTVCPCATGSIDFAAGGAGCDTVYMRKFPAKFGTTSNVYGYYRDETTPNPYNFCLKTSLENASDSEIAVSHAQCGTACTFGGTNYCAGANDYCVCVD